MILTTCILLAHLCTPPPTVPVRPQATLPAGRVSRIPRPHFDRFTLLHGAAAAYDGATTLRYISGCPPTLTCHEDNPVSRALIGARPQPARTIMVGAAVVLGVSLIPNRRVRHVAQVLLAGGHIAAGTGNLTRGYRQ